MKSQGSRMFALVVLAATAACAGPQIDRSAMSAKYWRIWDEKEQARIDADIEANRKADVTVDVDAPDGAEVRYEQISHDFRFGASTFNFGQLGSAELNRRYAAAFGEGGVFNQGTVPFYWREYEPEPGVIRAFPGKYEADFEKFWNALPREKAVKTKFWRRPPPGPIIDYLKSRGLRAHGHILVTGGFRPEWLYDKYCPDAEKDFLEGYGLPRHENYKWTWLQWEMWTFRDVCSKKLYPKLSEEEIGAALPVWTSEMRRLWRKRVLDIGALFGKSVDSWDVVNESARDFAKYGKSRTGLPVWKSFKGVMPGDFPLLALQDAKEAFPETAELVINENKIGEDFLKQVNDLTKEDVRIDLVGCQMHIMETNLMKRLSAGSTNVNWVGTPTQIRRRLNMMARTGRRIHISEVTIPQSEKGAKGLAVQAAAVRNLYRIWFSHKAVAGITWWNLVDGCSFPGEPQISGLFTRDLRKKPAYEVLESLINDEWRTRGVAAARDGKVSFRGFKGRYRLTWKDADGKAREKVVDAAAAARERFQIDRSVMSQKYWSIWNDKAQAKIDADIEKYRKADATVEVAAPDGTEVKVEQLTHAFHFGASIFNFDQLGTKERNDRYKALWGTLFNSATVPFYWRPLEPKAGAPRYDAAAEDSEAFWNACKEPEKEPHWRRPAPGPIIDYLRPLGVRIHGHVLVWGNYFQNPQWMWFDGCPDAEKAALEKASGVKFPLPGEQERFSAKDQKIFTNRLLDSAWGKVFGKMSEEQIAALVPTYFKNLEKTYENHVREIAGRFGDRVDSWDVVNESATMYGRFGRKAVRGKPFDEARYGSGGVCGQPMPADYAFKAFMWAQKALPERAVLSINDFHKTDTYVAQIKDLRAHGAQVEMVGAQMHLMNPKASAEIAKKGGRSPAAIAQLCDLLSEPGLPLHCSEITITAPDRTKRGEMVQAIIMRNFYRAWFSAEKMDGITWWNLVDDCGLPGEPSLSGLFTRDMRPKAAYYAMDDLINREWKTRTTKKVKGGKVSFRGFKGRYRLTWKDADGKEHEKIVDACR